MENSLGIYIYQVKSLDEYWIRLEKSLDFMLSHLRQKHEYGTSAMCSEYGIQVALAYSARRIAEKQGIDVHKTCCICMAVGLCFPPFGSYGMAACEKYIKDNNIPLSRNELKIGAIETRISDSGSVVTQQLDEALYAYYENSTAIPEVNVARYCQRKVKESRVMMRNGISANESIRKIMSEAEECFSVEQSLIVDDDIDIPSEIQEEVNRVIKEFVDYYGIPKGIFKYIA